MSENDRPLLVTEGTFFSLGQRYAIHRDRLELQFFVNPWGISIPFGEIEAISAEDPPVLRTSFWALKLDLADLSPHVRVLRRPGHTFSDIRFTPPEPERFVDTCLKAMEGWH